MDKDRAARFVGNQNSVIVPQCNGCKHFYIYSATCSAFTVAIPMVILSNEHDHRQPYPGDNGIQYEPITEQDAAVINQGP